MIIDIKILKDVCSTILTAVDSSDISKLSDMLEIKLKDSNFFLGVTNREYFVEVKIPVDIDAEFHATVNASLFLNLVQKTTTEQIELNVVDTFLEFKGNGKYKIPLIYNDSAMLELPRIELNNIVNEFTIDSSILKSILKFNSKELNRGVIVKPVQQLYYVDELGCITFTSGACVNNFTLPAKVSLLFSNKLVKLFKLFNSGDVNFRLSYESVSDEIIQARVSFSDTNITITSVLQNDTSLFNSIPVAAIRKRANAIYAHSILLNKTVLIQSLNRLMLFNSQPNSKQYLKFRFNDSEVSISDLNEINVETINYESSINTLSEPYVAILDASDLKALIDSSTENYIKMNFGDHQAIVLVRNNVLNIIPECILD